MERFIRVVWCIDFLYTLFGSIDSNNRLCFHFESTCRRCLDDSSSVLANTKITHILWADSNLCRHLDSSCILLNQIDPAVSSSQLIPEDRNYLTRTLHHFFKPSSILLDLAYSKNRLYFLYNSASLHIYNLSLSAWEPDLPLPLSSKSSSLTHSIFSHPISNGRLFIESNYLVLALNHGLESQSLFLFTLSPLQQISTISLPVLSPVPFAFPPPF